MTDLISREAAIAVLRELRERSYSDSLDGAHTADCAIEALTNMPSAEPFAELDRVSDILAGRRAETLGREFDTVWDANADKLYEP